MEEGSQDASQKKGEKKKKEDEGDDKGGEVVNGVVGEVQGGGLDVDDEADHLIGVSPINEERGGGGGVVVGTNEEREGGDGDGVSPMNEERGGDGGVVVGTNREREGDGGDGVSPMNEEHEGDGGGVVVGTNEEREGGDGDGVSPMNEERGGDGGVVVGTNREREGDGGDGVSPMNEEHEGDGGGVVVGTNEEHEGDGGVVVGANKEDGLPDRVSPMNDEHEGHAEVVGANKEHEGGGGVVVGGKDGGEVPDGVSPMNDEHEGDGGVVVGANKKGDGVGGEKVPEGVASKGKDREDPEVLPLQDRVEIYCFGGNGSGQLGIGTDEDLTLPLTFHPQFSKHNITIISCGAHHTAFVTDSGSVFTLGKNDDGQLGRKGRTRVGSVVPALDLMTIIDVSAGDNHTVAVGEDGQLFSWGKNHHGQLGLGIWDSGSAGKVRRVLNADRKKFVSVACGDATSFAMAETGEVYAFGNGTMGQMGSGDLVSYNKPTIISALFGCPVKSIACGKNHCLALTFGGNVYSWGSNKFGQLGIGKGAADQRRPHLIPMLQHKRAAQISSGALHSAAVTSDHLLYTWGQGSYGQLGHTSKEQESTPKVVMDLMGSRILKVACGRMHTLAIVLTLSNQLYKLDLYSWGFKNYLGKSNPTLTPSKVPTNFHVVDIFSNLGDHSFIAAYPQNSRTDKEHIQRVFQEKTSRGYQILTHNIEEFEKEYEKVVISKKKETTKLVRDVILGFSSASCLNGSFLDLTVTSEFDSGIDILGAQRAMDLIKSDDFLFETLTTATRRLMKSLTQLPKRPVYETLRLFMLQHINPVLSEYHLNSPILENFCKIFLGLSDSSKEVLSNWWMRMDPEFFLKTIHLHLNFLSYLLPKQNDSSSYISITLILNFFHQVNENYRTSDLRSKEKSQKSRNRRKVPYQNFYNDEVSKIDLEKDYQVWMGSSSWIFCFCRYSFLLNPFAKSQLIQIDAKAQQQREIQKALRNTFVSGVPFEPIITIIVSRETLVEDALPQFMQFIDVAGELSASLKKPLKVVFAGEDAVDEGGVRKEFFQLLVREIFTEKYGMFKLLQPSNNFWFSNTCFENQNMFKMVGMMMGLALYNSVILNVNFPYIIWKLLLADNKEIKQKARLSDVMDVFPEIGQNLVKLLDYQPTHENDVEETFCINFTVSFDFFGEVKVVELIDDGANTPVTNDNRHSYVQLYVDWLLFDSIKAPFLAFKEGFIAVCGGKVLELFRAEELEQAVCGDTEWDFEELEKVTQYKPPYSKNSTTIKHFWNVVHSLPLDLQKKLLFFATGSDRVPVQGLSHMEFTIQRMGPDSDFVPVAHTCFNILDLPDYQDEDKLREKLLYAITNFEGFGLQ